MISVSKLAVFFFLNLSIFFSKESLAGDFGVIKTELPVEGKFYHENLNLDRFLFTRDYANYSLGEDHRSGKPVIFRDTKKISFDEKLLFNLDSNSYFDTRTIASSFYQSFLDSLHGEKGKCRLDLFSEARKISKEDFLWTEKSYLDQPGKRMLIDSSSFPTPSWTLTCGNESNEEIVEKSGKTFFIFIEVYENQSSSGLLGHYAQYLFSLR